MPCRTNQERQTVKCVRQKELMDVMDHQKKKSKYQTKQHEEENMLLMRKIDNQKHNHGIENNSLIHQHESELTDER